MSKSSLFAAAKLANRKVAADGWLALITVIFMLYSITRVHGGNPYWPIGDLFNILQHKYQRIGRYFYELHSGGKCVAVKPVGSGDGREMRAQPTKLINK